ncbi:MAG: hypothetical protein ACI4SF_05910 [Oscillospiraceae bacterium]
MRIEVRTAYINGKLNHEVVFYPEVYQSPDTSNVGREFSELSVEGMFCYGLKVIVKLIKHFKYDYDKWYDFLVRMTDYTLIAPECCSMGRRSVYWDMADYSPEEILGPIVMPNGNNKRFYPCDKCAKKKLLFAEYGADSGLCLNCKNCGYVADHFRYNRPDKNQYSVGRYKEYYDLYMSADIDLLRVISDTFSLFGEIVQFVFHDDRMPIISDMLKVCEKLGIEPPDLSGIPEDGFGKGRRGFDCIGLIKDF